MELVTLGRVTLNRIGSASGRGFSTDKGAEEISEIPDESVESLRELVLSIAEKNGEQRSSLTAMTQETFWKSNPQRQVVIFNIQGPSTMYSTPYAECAAFPALKIGNRYFKLDEIKL